MNQEQHKTAERRSNDDEAYFNAQFDAKPVYVEAGEALFSFDDQSMIVSTLGSGVGISLYDEECRHGAFAYVLMPPKLLSVFPHFKKLEFTEVQNAVRPLQDAVEHMVSHGSNSGKLRVRLFGGGDFEGYKDQRGLKNFVFVQEHLNRFGLKVAQADIGGVHVRRVHFFPTKGQSVQRLLRRDYDYAAIYELEDNFKG